MGNNVDSQELNSLPNIKDLRLVRTRNPILINLADPVREMCAYNVLYIFDVLARILKSDY